MRITPTATLLLSADAPREDWLASRRQGITATDIPAILGLNKYKTAIDVWMEKVTDKADDFNPAIGNGEAALWGIQFEDIVAKTWADHMGFQVRRVGIIAHEDQPWMRASLDRLVKGCPDGRCAVEVKTRSSHVASDWSDRAPQDVEAQVLWQLLVSGLDHIHVIALLGGQKLVHHVITLDGYDTDRLRDLANIVWQSVQTGEAPILPSDLWTDAYLEQLHPAQEGSREIGDATLANLAVYRALSDDIKALTERRDAIKTQLVGALEGLDAGTYNGKTLYTYKASETRRLDSKRLAELYPAIAADDRVYTTTQSRTLRVSTPKEK